MSQQIVLLSGGIASGKTFVSNYLSELNACVIDTDVIAKSLLTTGMPLYSIEAIKEIRKSFGSQLFTDGILDRGKLRQEIFNSGGARKVLENIMHPLILHNVKRALQQRCDGYFLVIVPLLSRDSLYLQFADHVLITEVDNDLQIARVMQRDGVSRALALKIIESQATNEERRDFANTIIINTNKIHTQNILKQLDKRYSLTSSSDVVK